MWYQQLMFHQDHKLRVNSCYKLRGINPCDNKISAISPILFFLGEQPLSPLKQAVRICWKLGSLCRSLILPQLFDRYPRKIFMTKIIPPLTHKFQGNSKCSQRNLRKRIMYNISKFIIFPEDLGSVKVTIYKTWS